MNIKKILAKDLRLTLKNEEYVIDGKIRHITPIERQKQGS